MPILAIGRFWKQTGAGAVLIPESQRAYCPVAALIVKDPYLAFAKASAFFEVAAATASGVWHPAAVIDATARIADSASIGPNAVVEANVTVGEGARDHGQQRGRRRFRYR